MCSSRRAKLCEYCAPGIGYTELPFLDVRKNERIMYHIQWPCHESSTCWIELRTLFAGYGLARPYKAQIHLTSGHRHVSHYQSCYQTSHDTKTEGGIFNSGHQILLSLSCPGANFFLCSKGGKGRRTIQWQYLYSCLEGFLMFGVIESDSSCKSSLPKVETEFYHAYFVPTLWVEINWDMILTNRKTSPSPPSHA